MKKKKLVNRVLNYLALCLMIGMFIGVLLVFGFGWFDGVFVFYFSMIACVIVYFVYKRVNKKRSRLWGKLKKGLKRFKRTQKN